MKMHDKTLADVGSRCVYVLSVLCVHYFVSGYGDDRKLELERYSIFIISVAVCSFMLYSCYRRVM